MKVNKSVLQHSLGFWGVLWWVFLWFLQSVHLSASVWRTNLLGTELRSPAEVVDYMHYLALILRTGYSEIITWKMSYFANPSENEGVMQPFFCIER